MDVGLSGDKDVLSRNGTTTTTIKINLNWNQTNITGLFLDDQEYLFDRTDVRLIFITLYTIVFSCCFFGNLLVIIVMTLSRRLRSITNFFLANLALADFCVGVFCVYQNLSMYMISTWVLGDFFCKMYQFIHSLSYTASIFILVVICMERYFAILHPLTCKQILTPTRLRLMIGVVWFTSAVYSAPRFIWVQTIDNRMLSGEIETICATHRKKYNSQLFDMINFVLLYIIPLIVMTVLYTRIALELYHSSQQLVQQLNASSSSSTSTVHYQRQKQHMEYSYQYYYYNSHMCNSNSQFQIQQSPIQAHSNKRNRQSNFVKKHLLAGNQMSLQHPDSSQNVLRARRRVIRMLIIVVLTFALCNLPFHARKLWQYYSTGYDGSSNFSTLFTPLTFLVMYLNSGLNPLIYTILSRNFRRGIREILICPTSRRFPNKKFYNSATLNINSNNYQLQRQMSVRSSCRTNSTATTIINHVNNNI